MKWITFALLADPGKVAIGTTGCTDKGGPLLCSSPAVVASAVRPRGHLEDRSKNCVERLENWI